MKLIADLSKGTLSVNGKSYLISNNIRTLKNGKRKRCEVVYTITYPNSMPYDPQPFPKGIWSITGVEWQKDKGFDEFVYGTVKIRTDACQYVKVWELDGDGDYLKERTMEVNDTGYLLHYSESPTTLGCIKIENQDSAESIARQIEEVFGRGEKVELEVV